MKKYDHTKIKIRDAQGNKGMVSSGSNYASEAGAAILREGGNAVDAAVATSLALSVAATPFSGIGGGGFMMIHMADQNKSVMIDYRENAPQLAKSNMFDLDNENNVINEQNHLGEKAAAIPGTFAGMSLALEQFGTMQLNQVSKSAIELGKNGFEITPFLEWVMSTDSDLALTKLNRSKEAASIWLKSDGSTYKSGELMKNVEMAQTIERVSKNGIGSFYEGFVAEQAERHMIANNGPMRAKDFSLYKAKMRTPVSGMFNGFHYITSAPPSSGGIALHQLLTIFQDMDLAGSGHNTVETIDKMSRVLKQVYIARDLIADPDYENIDSANLMSTEFINSMQAQVNPHNDYSGGDGSQTSHFSVVDKYGNSVSCTESVEAFFGSGVVIPGTGIFLNNTMGDFDPIPNQLNSIKPGKRPRSAMAPTIFLKNNKPALVIGSAAGPRIITAVAQVAMNVLVHNMDVQSAINAPRFHYHGDDLVMEGRISNEVASRLTKIGYSVKKEDDVTYLFGGVHAITISDSGEVHGGADPRRDGVAVSE
ncbi:MAG: gamma-glutamyltranspeptidase / glutathione hydrolase [Chloroflexi bacterium]|jgi:gamma-glutamyltranspeptidase/glutathione hydrolase|nr:MAG: gamma-glutamyltranspeptidase / glutathione hydrolase [Chloroflexota bacterium]